MYIHIFIQLLKYQLLELLLPRPCHERVRSDSSAPDGMVKHGLSLHSIPSERNFAQVYIYTKLYHEYQCALV